jgi:hypothetical protein
MIKWEYRQSPTYIHISAGPNIIVPVLGQVPHPWERFVPTLVHDLEIAHLEARHSKVRNLKLYIDWILLVFIAVWRFYCGQFELSIHHVLPFVKLFCTYALGKT